MISKCQSDTKSEYLSNVVRESSASNKERVSVTTAMPLRSCWCQCMRWSSDFSGDTDGYDACARTALGGQGHFRHGSPAYPMAVTLLAYSTWIRAVTYQEHVQTYGSRSCLAETSSLQDFTQTNAQPGVSPRIADQFPPTSASLFTFAFYQWKLPDHV